jgi:hypothetical protein
MEITTQDDPIAAKVLGTIKGKQDREEFTIQDKALIFIRNFIAGLGLICAGYYINSHYSNPYYAFASMIVIVILYALCEVLLYWIAFASKAGEELKKEPEIK